MLFKILYGYDFLIETRLEDKPFRRSTINKKRVKKIKRFREYLKNIKIL